MFIKINKIEARIQIPWDSENFASNLCLYIYQLFGVRLQSSFLIDES